MDVGGTAHTLVDLLKTVRAVYAEHDSTKSNLYCNTLLYVISANFYNDARVTKTYLEQMVRLSSAMAKQAE